MPRPRRSTFDEAEVSAIFLIPLHNGAAGHGCTLDGNNSIQQSRTDDHPAGMLTEMARQVIHSRTKLKVLAYKRMSNVKACLVEMLFHCVIGASPLPVADEAGEFRKLLLIESESFSNFTGRRSAAIGDYVGGHGGAKGSILLIDILNDFFTMIT